MKIKILLTQEEYDLVTLELGKLIEGGGDLRDVRALVELLDTFENDYQEVPDEEEK